MSTAQAAAPDLQRQRELQSARELQRIGRRNEAIAAFRELLERHPGDGELWYELGYLLKAEGRYAESLDAFGQALANGVTRPEEVHLNRGVVFSDHLRRDDAAERELHAALALAPNYVPALLNLGNLQEERGERENAIATYERALAGPESPDPAHNHLRMEGLARISYMRPPADLDDPMLQRLREAAETQPDRTVRADLLFALGHAYDRLGAQDPAFEAFAMANRWLLRQTGRRYDRAHTERLTDALIAAFPRPDDVLEGSAAPRQQPEPLFVCGMFRSGSTLVEQVLGAHPQVVAGGELNYLRRLAAVRLAPFPQSMTGLHSTAVAELAGEYRAHLSMLFPQAREAAYVTDKRPDNFQLIGLVKRLLPAAKIVHTTRHPLDNGLSVFSHHLHPQVAAYACDLADIGHYYGQYRRLMAHWKAVYPDDILDFDYDTFVADPMPALERLLAFLGLPWDTRCLEFHRLGNTVKTASYWQIRRPLHRDASGRWRRYASHLEPLRQALRDAGVPMPLT